MLLSWLKLYNRFPLYLKLNPTTTLPKAREDPTLSGLAYLFCIMSSLSSLSYALAQLVPKKPEILFCNKALNFDQPITIHTEHLVSHVVSVFRMQFRYRILKWAFLDLSK